MQLASTRTPDRKSTRLNSSHASISYAVFCLKKKRRVDGFLRWLKRVIDPPPWPNMSISAEFEPPTKTATPPHSFFFNDTATTEIYTLSLHDALPICSTRTAAYRSVMRSKRRYVTALALAATKNRSEEHTSELQSRFDLVCRLLL